MVRQLVIPSVTTSWNRAGGADAAVAPAPSFRTSDRDADEEQREEDDRDGGPPGRRASLAADRRRRSREAAVSAARNRRGTPSARFGLRPVPRSHSRRQMMTPRSVGLGIVHEIGDLGSRPLRRWRRRSAVCSASPGSISVGAAARLSGRAVLQTIAKASRRQLPAAVGGANELGAAASAAREIIALVPARKGIGIVPDKPASQRQAGGCAHGAVPVGTVRRHSFVRPSRALPRLARSASSIISTRAFSDG